MGISVFPSVFPFPPLLPPPRLRYDVTLLRSRDNLCESVSGHQIRLPAQLEKQNGTAFLSLGIVLTTYSPHPPHPTHSWNAGLTIRWLPLCSFSSSGFIYFV